MPKSIAVKPLLTEMHKVQHVMFATSKLSGASQTDEKWLVLYSGKAAAAVLSSSQTKKCRGEMPRIEITRSRQCFCVSFLLALDITPQETALPATKIVNSNKDTYRRYTMIGKAIPVIRMEWLDRGMNQTHIVQHGGASSQSAENDQEFNLHAKQGVWNICLETQPVKCL